MGAYHLSSIILGPSLFFFCSEIITGRVMGLEQDPEDQAEDRQEEVTERGRGDLGWRRGNPGNCLAVLEL